MRICLHTNRRVVLVALGQELRVCLCLRVCRNGALHRHKRGSVLAARDATSFGDGTVDMDLVLRLERWYERGACVRARDGAIEILAEHDCFLRSVFNLETERGDLFRRCLGGRLLTRLNGRHQLLLTRA